MKELSIEEKAKAYDKVREKIALRFGSNVAEDIFSEFEISEDEKIRKAIINIFATHKDYEVYFGVSVKDIRVWLEKTSDKCLVNFDEAEQEKYDFVSGQYIECRASFNEFKEDNSYWLEYVGDDNYIGRSDNILNQKFHITPRQLYRLFSQQHCYKEDSNVNDETNAPTEYGKYVDECLNEASKHFFSEGEDKYSVADLFYAGVRCGKSWLEKQGEQSNWKPSKDEMDALYGLAYITNKMDDKKDEAITKLYQDLKREFFNEASYENMFPSCPVDSDINVEKQGEQKIAWSEEVQEEQVSEEFINALGTMLNDGLPDRYLVSEERIKKSAELLFLIARKQLKNEMREWSEEDNAILEKCVGAVKSSCYSRSFKLEAENWLKSLRPQNRWKPSNEQIGALEHFVRSIGESGFASPYESNTNSVYLLLSDLKKLKG